MTRETYVKQVNEKLDGTSKNIMLEQIDTYYAISNYVLPKHNYSVGDSVYLRKGTLLHGTYKNIKGLEEIVNGGLISGWFIDGRLSKYPSSVGVWNLKQNYSLKDYIHFYSGGTILYSGIYFKGIDTGRNKTAVIPYDEMAHVMDVVNKYDCHMWVMEQTKEARFMPSLVQDRVQIGIIFDGQSKEIKRLLKGDILSKSINDEDVQGFVNPDYIRKFLRERKHKDDFFTDRESAVLFGIPANFIEGILVGRKYEKDKKILTKIKALLPNAYICNLDGKVIVV